MKVSIIIPTYNYGHKIGEAINSIIVQDYPADLVEIIIVDDGSADDTRAVIENLGLNNIIYFYQNNSGKASATKKAIELSSGEIIFNLDADDIFLQRKISSSVEIYKKYDNVTHVSSPALIINKNLEQTLEPIPLKYLNTYIDGNHCLISFYSDNILFGGGSTFSCKSKLLKSAQIADSVNMYIDELLVLIALKNGATYFLPEPLSVWNIHGSNYSATDKTKIDSKKNLSLLKSSEFILDFLLQNNYSNELIKYYKLKHYTMIMFNKEIEHTKSIKDILMYFEFLIIKNNYSYKTIKSYNSLNRLLPIFLFNTLKKITNKCY